MINIDIDLLSVPMGILACFIINSFDIISFKLQLIIDIIRSVKDLLLVIFFTYFN